MRRQWLVDIRIRKGMTQLNVATRSYIERSYYTQIEKGMRTPSISVAKNIAHVLDFNPIYFFFENISDPFYVSLKNAPIVIGHCDLELRYTWIFNPHPDFRPESVIGKRDDEINLNSGTLDLIRLKEEVIKYKKSVRRLIRFPLSDGCRTYHVYGEPLILEDGIIVGVSTTSTDITEVLGNFLSDQ